MAQLYTNKKYKQINFAERVIIETLLNEQRTNAYIARQLGRHESTISREIKNGTYKTKYRAHIAHNRATKNRNKKQKLLNNTDLMHRVEQLLKEGWSPEDISDELAGQISHTTIYTLCHTHRPEWHKYLTYQGKYKYHKGCGARTIIPNRVDISMRPPVEFGDWEADTVIPARGGRAVLAVFVEKTTRFYKVVKMANKTADEMLRATLTALDGLPVKSITYDNGSENVAHEWTNRLLGCVSYFARAFCSSDKPQIEERNKRLRRWIRKKTTFDLLSEEEIAIVEDRINKRPMKVLNRQTPLVAFSLQSLHFKL